MQEYIHLLHRITTVQGSDTTMPNSSNTAGNKKIIVPGKDYFHFRRCVKFKVVIMGSTVEP